MEFDNIWALEKAKSNVEKYFPVVAVLEMYDESLVVMENLVPEFFEGIQNMHQKRKGKGDTDAFKGFLLSVACEKNL